MRGAARRRADARASRRSTGHCNRDNRSSCLPSALEANLRRRRTSQTEVIQSFVQSPHIGDDPEYFILLRAAAMERLHRTTGAATDNSKQPRVRQQTKVRREKSKAGTRKCSLQGQVLKGSRDRN